MFTTLFTSADVVASSLTGLAIMSLAAAIICFLGLSWSNERWRVPAALVGTACLVTAVYYAGAAGYWFNASKVPVGVFWRLGGAAILMVFGRWLGDAGFFDESLGAILSIGFWLYILGELYFGAIPDRIRAAARPIKLGYFWIRLLFTLGWAVYPILHFVDTVIGVGHAPAIIVLYSTFDIVNLIIPSLIVVAVAGQDRY